jgi:hypothetical protein
MPTLTTSAFLGTIPADEPITSGLPVIQEQRAWERKFQGRDLRFGTAA